MVLRILLLLGLISFPTAANAAPIFSSPLVGTVTISDPDANNRRVGTVDFGFDFVAAGLSEDLWQQLFIEMTFTLEPGTLEPGEGVWFIGLANNLILLPSDFVDSSTRVVRTRFPPYNLLQMEAVSSPMPFVITPLSEFTMVPPTFGVSGRFPRGNSRSVSGA